MTIGNKNEKNEYFLLSSSDLRANPAKAGRQSVFSSQKRLSVLKLA
jgi:hypothetical protein